MRSKRLKGKDILLALLYSPTSSGGEVCVPITGTTRITKAFFLFEEELKEKFSKDDFEEMPKFIAWDFGPWSDQLIDDIEFFIGIGFIDQEIVNSPDISLADSAEINKIKDEIEAESFEDDEYSQKKYTLTPIGKGYVEEKIWNKFSTDQKNILKKFKYKINSISLFTLIRYVYNKYEKWTENSTIKEKVL